MKEDTSLLSKNTRKTHKLVVFDVEGIIIPKNRYLLLEASKNLGIYRTLLVIIVALLYEAGAVSLEYALRRIYRLFKGTSLSEFHRIFRCISTIPNTFEVFKQLKDRKYKIALMSSGLPILFVEDLAIRLGADYAFGLKLETVNEYLTGEISGDIFRHDGKAVVLRELQKRLELSPKDCVVVADDRNNVPMLPLCDKSIGYNPDFIFAIKCNYAVKGGLIDILPYIDPNTKKGESMNSPSIEFFRETIHIGSFIIPVICKYLKVDIYLISTAITVVTIIYIVSELIRMKGREFPLLYAITSKAAVGEEKWSFATSPIIFAMSIVLTLLIFPIPVNYVAIASLTLGDGCASIFGRKFGKTAIPFNKQKSMEGTIVGLFAAFLGTLIFTDPLRGVVAAGIGMTVEVIPSPINDNISIPIISGMILMLL